MTTTGIQNGHDFDAARRDARSRWLMIIAIVLMFAMWLLVVLNRREIRAWWWERRLEQTTELSERMHYVELLASAGSAALPAGKRLLNHDDVSMRSFGVVLAQRLPGEDATDLLIQATHDGESAIRDGAMLSLSRRESPRAVEALEELTEDADLDTAMLATRCLVNTRAESALAVLQSLATDAQREGVRAQAITSLGEWDGADVVPTLVKCLSDDAIFKGLTATEQAAQATLAQAAPHLASEDTFPPEDRPTNGERAAILLQAITGEDHGYLSAARDDRENAIKEWQAWSDRAGKK